MKRKTPLLPLQFKFCLTALLCAVALTAQIAQDHPELCGRTASTGPVVPQGVFIDTDSSIAESDLILTHGRDNVKIRIPGAMSDVQEVCPLPGNRVLAFGMASSSLYNIVLADLTAGRIVDSFYGFSPVVSPNQNWLIVRKFYPASAQTTVSEEYLLYDLNSSSPRKNRTDDVLRSDTASVGRSVYPLGQQNVPWDNIGVPESQVHQFRSRVFFWSPNSTAVVFADSLRNALSIVYIAIKQDGKTATYIHPVRDSDMCTANDISSVMLSDVTFDRSEISSLSIQVELTSNRPGCASRILSLRLDDFTPATVEKHLHSDGKPSILKE